MIVDDNVYIGKLATRGGWSFLLSRPPRQTPSYWVDRLRSARSSASENRRTLGGNQQKVVLAKLWRRIRRSSFFRRPTRGVDVAPPHIHAEIRRLADEGKADSVIRPICRRSRRLRPILVARTGRIVAGVRRGRRDPGQDFVRGGALTGGFKATAAILRAWRAE